MQRAAHLARTAWILIRLIWEHPPNKGQRLQTYARAAGWQFYKHTIRKPFDLTVYGDLKLRAYSDSGEPSRFIYFGGVPDYAEMTFMRRYLRPGDGFIDCGANVGTYTLLAAQLVGAAGRVDAFEAAPQEAGRLRENIARNSLRHCVVHQVAVGAEPGRLSFTTDRGAGNRMARDEDAQRAQVDVEVVPLSDRLPSRPYAMGKLDVEGAELLALKGAKSLLERQVPPVWEMELVDRFARRFGTTAVELEQWLNDHGYDLATFNPTTGQLNFRSGLAGSQTNVFAVARGEARDLVLQRLADAAGSVTQPLTG